MRKSKSNKWCAGAYKRAMQMVEDGQAHFRYVRNWEPHRAVEIESDGKRSLKSPAEKIGVLLAVRDPETGEIQYGYSLVHFRYEDRFDHDGGFGRAFGKIRKFRWTTLPDKVHATKHWSAIDEYVLVKKGFVERAEEKLRQTDEIPVLK